MIKLLESILSLFSKKQSDTVTQVHPSPPDERDYTVCRAMEISPDMQIPADFEVWQPPVANQGSTGNCVAQSLANIMECIAHNYGEEHRDYSVGFIYGAPENSASTGMYPREACNIILNRGDLLASEYETNLENPSCKSMWKRISADLLEKAETRKVMAYIRLNTKEEMQAFMLKYNLPVMIVAQSKAYFRTASGRHATVCYGWVSEETFNKDRQKYNDWTETDVGYEDILFTNSWGTSYHNGDGRGACKFKDIEEIWGVVPMEKIKLTDIENCWAKQDIEYLVELGLIKGYEDNTFRPDESITRAEMAALLARVLRDIKD